MKIDRPESGADQLGEVPVGVAEIEALRPAGPAHHALDRHALRFEAAPSGFGASVDVHLDGLGLPDHTAARVRIKEERGPSLRSRCQRGWPALSLDTTSNDTTRHAADRLGRPQIRTWMVMQRPMPRSAVALAALLLIGLA